MLEPRRAHGVAEQVAPVDGEPAHVPPLRRIADLRSEGRQLGMGLGLGVGAHPVELVDAPVHRGDHVVDQVVGRGLGLGREIPGDVQLADVVAERSDGEAHRAFPAFLLLGRAVERRPEESEALLVEPLRQIGRVSVQRAHQQLVAKHRQRRAADQRRNAFERARLEDDDVVDVHSVGLGECRKIEAGSDLVKLGERQLVVGLADIAALGSGPVDLGDPGLEIENRLGARGGVRLSREAEHVGQVLKIFRLRLDELGVLRQIIVAVGHSQTALEDVQRILVGRLAVLADEHVERDADPQSVRLRVEVRKPAFRLEFANLAEPRLERRQALRFDGGGVHEARVSGADPAVRVLRLLLDDRAGALARQVVEDVERTIVRLVGGDRRGLRPGAVGELIEIVAGSDAAVHSGGIEPERAILRLGRRRSDRDAFGLDRRRGNLGNGRRTSDQRRGRRKKRKRSNHSFPSASG